MLHVPTKNKNCAPLVSPNQILTRQLVDPGLGGHVRQGDDAPGDVAGGLVHLQEGVRADATAGVVGHVDGVSAGSLHGESRCWVRRR